jgi:hypothetical protein
LPRTACSLIYIRHSGNSNFDVVLTAKYYGEKSPRCIIMRRQSDLRYLERRMHAACRNHCLVIDAACLATCSILPHPIKPRPHSIRSEFSALCWEFLTPARKFSIVYQSCVSSSNPLHCDSTVSSFKNENTGCTA